jgi:trimethylamine--corrinoid protein Co-methyltransferase
MEDHTVDHMMTEFTYPEFAVRSNFDIWEQQGRRTMMDRARQRVREILDEHAAGLIRAEVRDRIEQAFPGALRLSDSSGRRP